MNEKVKVLLVDEQSEQRNAYRDRFLFTGYEVVGATGNPRKALELISSEKPDVVLFDIVLSPIDGIMFLKEAVSLNLDKRPLLMSSICSVEVISWLRPRTVKMINVIKIAGTVVAVM